MKSLTEYLVECLSSTALFEMAYKRKRFIEIISNHTTQIVQNWCLVKYVSLSGEKQTLRNHWEGEFLTQITDMREMKLKNNDSYDNRCNAINQVFVIESEFNKSYNSVYMTIAHKFELENIDTRSYMFNKTIHEFMKSINDIVSVIATNDYDKAKTYITSL